MYLYNFYLINLYLYIENESNYLKATIEAQFPVETIQESVVMCMTQNEIDRVTMLSKHLSK